MLNTRYLAYEQWALCSGYIWCMTTSFKEMHHTMSQNLKLNIRSVFLDSIQHLQLNNLRTNPQPSNLDQVTAVMRLPVAFLSPSRRMLG